MPQESLRERGVFPPGSGWTPPPRLDQWPPGGERGVQFDASEEWRGSPSGLSGLSPELTPQPHASTAIQRAPVTSTCQPRCLRTSRVVPKVRCPRSSRVALASGAP